MPRNPPNTTRPTSPTPPVPTLDALLEMTPEEISGLSIGTLKTILFRNHVNAGGVLEKSDLVSKVKTLVEDERQERAEAIRRAEDEEREMWAIRERAAQQERERREREQARVEEAAGSASEGASEQSRALVADDDESVPPPPPPDDEKPKARPVSMSSAAGKAKSAASFLERTGLCVICQDEEANIAIVDCG